MKKLIKLEPEGMKGLHFYTEGLNYPVAVGTYSDREEALVSCLSRNIEHGKFNTEDICRWCFHHQIRYQIVYPIRKRSIFENPYKYYKFLQLKRRLREYHQS